MDLLKGDEDRYAKKVVDLLQCNKPVIEATRDNFKSVTSGSELVKESFSRRLVIKDF